MKAAIVNKETALIGMKRKYPTKISGNTLEKSFREKVARIMRDDGASEEFIKRELTDTVVKRALKNNFSAESLAWALLQ